MSKLWNIFVTVFMLALISIQIFAGPMSSIVDNGYIGLHVGAALAKYDVSNPYGHSIYGDIIRVPSFNGGIQAGYNWQISGSNTLLGIEASLSGLDGEAANTCFAYSGHYVSSNGVAHPNISGTLTGRVGFAIDNAGRTLCYLKAGLAALNSKVIVSNNNVFFGTIPVAQNYTSSTQWGGDIGAGFELMLTPEISMKLEYNYLRLADSSIYAPPSLLLSKDNETVSVIPGAKADVSQAMHQLTLGVNYYLFPSEDNISKSVFYHQAEFPSQRANNHWNFEVGLRYFYSYGRFQKNMPLLDQIQSSLISRLVYDKLGAHSGEIVAEVDTPWPFFVKAIAGVGRITSGQLNDEDWGLPKVFFGVPVAYSNTLSDLDDTKLRYATVDLGYEFLSGNDYRLALLLGYNHIHERYTANDIVQLAFGHMEYLTLPGRAVITETDKWNSFRVGFGVRAWFNPSCRLDLDVAYLPYVRLNGEDDHWLRGLVITELSSGRGVQFDALASYSLTPQFRVGLGGRYWAAWSNGSDEPNGQTLPRVDTYRYERFGVFVQGSYAIS